MAAQPMTEKDKSVFLAALAESGSVTQAAAVAKVSRTNIYLLRKRDADFAAAFEEARERGLDKLEDRQFEDSEFDIQARQWTLSRLRPDKWGTRKVVEVVSEPKPVDIVVRFSDGDDAFDEYTDASKNG